MKHINRIMLTALLISLCMCFAVFISFADSNLTGDVNSDGTIDYSDAELIFNYVSGNGILSLDELNNSDINGDGAVTIVDAAQVLHYANRVISEIPYKHKGRAFLQILSFPDKTEYLEGEELDMTGFVLQAVYENGKIEKPLDYTFGGYSSRSGVKIIVVEYEGSKTAFTVTVYPDDILSLDIVALPDKLSYVEGEELDLTGLRVIAINTEGEKREVDAYTVDGFESVTGTHTVNITYRSISVGFSVTVE